MIQSVTGSEWKSSRDAPDGSVSPAFRLKPQVQHSASLAGYLLAGIPKRSLLYDMVTVSTSRNCFLVIWHLLPEPWLRICQGRDFPVSVSVWVRLF